MNVSYRFDNFNRRLRDSKNRGESNRTRNKCILLGAAAEDFIPEPPYLDPSFWSHFKPGELINGIPRPRDENESSVLFVDRCVRWASLVLDIQQISVPPHSRLLSVNPLPGL